MTLAVYSFVEPQDVVVLFDRSGSIGFYALEDVVVLSIVFYCIYYRAPRCGGAV